MRRILIVVGLVVLLAATIVVPAVAETSTGGDRFREFLASVLEKPVNATLGLEETNAFRDFLGLPPIDRDGFVISPVNSNDDSGFFSSSDPEEPAVSQEFSERRIESGSASPSSSFSNTGDNVNACPTTQQVVNTGNVANQQGVVQYNSTTDDIDATGSSINITSDQTVTCEQTLNQAAEAGE